MRVPMEWLRSLTPLQASADDVAERLAAAGFEVDTIHRTSEHWDDVVVGEVVKIDPHPDADRLNLPTVRFGAHELQVVCGAWNFKVGDKIPFAQVGARLWDPYSNQPKLKELKPSKIRGVVSRGMLCSPKELGLSDEHEGIVILDGDATVGAPLAEVLGDEVIEFELKPNRPDALSMLGIAREAAALFATPLRVPGPDADDSRASLGLDLHIDIEDPELCPRYAAAFVVDVSVAQSPAWMQERLELAGLRPINNIVDVTNYVMWELGQPLHAFDWETLRGGHIGVRTARAGERLTTLDGQDRELTEDALLIVDGEGPVALAGVMGGLSTEVTERTRTVLLESATFNPISIRRTAQRLNLRSEASRRFEKGLPPELTILALRRCVQLLEEIGAGRGEFLSADAYPQPSTPPPVRFPFQYIERLMGVAYPRDEVRSLLKAIEFEVADEADDLVITPPFWRRDVKLAADVVEEVARLAGYDRIPDRLPVGGVAAAVPGETDPRDDNVRDIMVGLGFIECVTYVLTSPARMARLLGPEVLETNEDESPLGTPDDWRGVRAEHMNDAGRVVTDRLLPLDRDPVALQNPLSADESVLRLTGLATMLETLRANRRVTDHDLLLFDYQPLFVARPGDLPEELRSLTLVSGQRVSSERWAGTSDVDLGFIRGAIDELLRRLGLPVGVSGTREPRLRHVPLTHPTFHPAQSAVIELDGTAIGAYGQIEPAVAAQFDLDERAWAGLLDLDRILGAARTEYAFEPWSDYPPALRDLAIILDAGVAEQDIELTIRRSGKGLVQDLRLFDEYRGEQIPAGQRSLAFAITYAADDRTLTDAEVDAAHERIVQALGKRFGAVLRG